MEYREQQEGCTGRRKIHGDRAQTQGKQKLSSGMAMILGALLTIEIMIGGAMILNFDFKGADIIAVVLAFMVLYFAVVASLTDK